MNCSLIFKQKQECSGHLCLLFFPLTIREIFLLRSKFNTYERVVIHVKVTTTFVTYGYRHYFFWNSSWSLVYTYDNYLSLSTIKHQPTNDPLSPQWHQIIDLRVLSRNVPKTEFNYFETQLFHAIAIVHLFKKYDCHLYVSLKKITRSESLSGYLPKLELKYFEKPIVARHSSLFFQFHTLATTMSFC